MTIKKFQGKTKEEAIALAKEEMGASVVIMNVKEVRQKGFLGIFKGSMYEVTAALEAGIFYFDGCRFFRARRPIATLMTIGMARNTTVPATTSPV